MLCLTVLFMSCEKTQEAGTPEKLYWGYENIGAFFNYRILTYGNNASTGTVNEVVAKDTTMHGRTYKKIQSTYTSSGSSSSGERFFAYDNGNYLVLLDPTAGSNLTYLKNEMAAGSSWFNEFPSVDQQGNPVTYRYNFECVEAISSMVVENNTYQDVLKIKKTYAENGTTISGYEAFDWVAKGVGIIKSESWSNGTKDQEQLLSSYQLN